MAKYYHILAVAIALYLTPALDGEVYVFFNDVAMFFVIMTSVTMAIARGNDYRSYCNESFRTDLSAWY